MKTKTRKRLFFTIAMGCSVLALTGCTKSFCSVQDTAEMMARYEKNNIDKVNETAEKNGLLLPKPVFISFIEKEVESYTKLAECPKDDEGVALASFARYAGYNEKGKPELWANFDVWYNKAIKELGVENVPGSSYINYYKKSLVQGANGSTACLTPSDGDFGLSGNEIFVEGKTWGEAFNYGFIEGLLVYPIGAMLHYFGRAFGSSGAGLLGAVFLLTVILRTLTLLITLPSTLTQAKMSELQPKLALLQEKYPNANTNSQDKQRLAAEQMKLYKDNKVHPFRQMLFMFLQFPIFIAVWAALQGSALLSSGTVLGLEFTQQTFSAIMDGNVTAILLFLVMSVAQIISTLLPQWFTKWKEKTMVVRSVKVQQNSKQKSMQMVSYFMLVFILIMGFTLPAAMGFYWLVGAIFTICQNLIIEAVHTHNRKKSGGSGTSNTGQSWNRNKNKKKNSSDKFRVRKG